MDEEKISSHGDEKVEDTGRVFREGDFVSLHARLTEETRRFVGREHLGLTKPTAYFVNNARSRMIRHDDLYEVLKEGCIAGAALDVHDDEPLGEGNLWMELGNVTLTTHLAGVTREAWEKSVRMAAEAIRGYAENDAFANTVNREALERRA